MKRFPYVLLVAIAAIYVAVWLSPPTTRASRAKSATRGATTPTAARPDAMTPRETVRRPARRAPIANAAPANTAAAVVREPQGPGFTITEGPTVTPAELNRDLRMLAVEPGTRQEDRLFPRPKRIKPELAEEKISIAPAEPAAPVKEGEIVRAAPARPARLVQGTRFRQVGRRLPPDTNGDVGPNHYIQTVNTAVGIYAKTRHAAVRLQLRHAVHRHRHPLRRNNNGDPIVLYDPQADRWILTDFALTHDNGALLRVHRRLQDRRPGRRRLVAVRLARRRRRPQLAERLSQAGRLARRHLHGRQHVRLRTHCGRDQLPGLGPSTATDLKRRRRAAVIVDVDMTTPSPCCPATRAAPPRRPAAQLLHRQDADRCSRLNIYKFHVDYAGRPIPPSPAPPTCARPSPARPTPSPARQRISIRSGERLMMQNQYRNLGGTESLWVKHTAGTGAGNDRRPAAVVPDQRHRRHDRLPRPCSSRSTATSAPDGKHRWIPSLAVDQDGNMAIGYSARATRQPPTSATPAGWPATRPTRSATPKGRSSPARRAARRPATAAAAVRRAGATTRP